MMNNSFGSIKGREQKFRSIVSSDGFRSDLKLVFNETNEIFDMLRDFRLGF
jgi:hypothetical protein